MTERRRGLGRGLGALIPMRTVDERVSEAEEFHERADDRANSRDSHAHEPPQPSADIGVDTASLEPVQSTDEPHAQGQPPPVSKGAGIAHFAEIPVDAITTNPRQPRQVFDEDALAELTDSILQVGILQPVVVREITESLQSSDRPSAPAYELVMGERRWRAAQAAGLATVPAIVRETKDDALLRDALLENLHRAQLNPLEEAAAYDQMLADFGCTQDELAQRIGRSRPQISNTIRLLRLPLEVQRRVAAGVLTAGHARALLGIDDRSTQERMAQRIVAEGLSVRTVEELVAMGDLAPADRAPRRQHAPVAPALADLGARLSERFETRVKVDLGRRKGKITIEFASIADLERIVGVMDPPRDEAPEAAAS